MARCSARILPVTMIEDSWVRSLMVSNSASGSALFTATHCISPVPSRTMGKTILPDLRRLYSQPRICTVSPMCREASAIVAIVIRGAFIALGPHRPWGRPSACGRPPAGLLAGPGDPRRPRACPTICAALHKSSNRSNNSTTVARENSGASFNSSSSGYWSVDVRGADAVFHHVEGRLHAFADVGMPHIEDEAQIQVRLLQEKHQALAARKSVGNILQQDLDSPLAREKADLLQRRKGRIDSPLGILFAGDADVLDHVLEWNRLGDFQRALDLIDHFQALALHRFGDGDHRLRPRAAPEFVVVHGRVNGMKLQIRVVKPVAQFGFEASFHSRAH